MKIFTTWKATSMPEDDAVSAYHMHHSCEFLFIREGIVSMNIGGKEYILHAGQLAVISALEAHDLYPRSFPYSRIGLHINCDHLSMLEITPLLASILIFRNPDGRQIFSLAEHPQAIDLIERLNEELQNDRLGKDEMTRLLFHELLLNLYRISPHSFRQNRADARMEEARSYIESHIGDRTTVEEIAARYYLTTSHFIACFKEYTGFTPHKYRKLCQVANARCMLMEGKLSLSDIAEKCGFLDVNSFIRCFRETMQITPMKFKEMHRGKYDMVN